MKRHHTFIQLAFGWKDADSGYGAGNHTSPELRSFFEGWMGDVAPKTTDINDLCHLKSSFTKDVGDEAKERLLALSNRLEELAGLIRAEIQENEPQP